MPEHASDNSRRHTAAVFGSAVSAGASHDQTHAMPAAVVSEAAPVMVADLDYDLPPEVIAQTPTAERTEARLLVDQRTSVQHRFMSDFPELLKPGDLLVVNDTRVLPARLRMRRASGGAVEVLLLHESNDNTWEALVRPSRRLRCGEVVTQNTAGKPHSVPSQHQPPEHQPPEHQHTEQQNTEQSAKLSLEIGDDLGEGRRLVKLRTGGRRLLQVLQEVGEVPLPPYITEPIADSERYQTVYGRRSVSAASPTAGLHFTKALLDQVRAVGAEVAAVELAVGLDTFRPVTAERLDDHEMHTEHYNVPESVQHSIKQADRVVAVGTTVVRCLEAWAATGAASGRTSLFIRRPYPWRVVDALLTNFHLPRSTLLCLLDAFVGPRWRTLYDTALNSGYRFLSFGDAMFVSRASTTTTSISAHPTQDELP